MLKDSKDRWNNVRLISEYMCLHLLSIYCCYQQDEGLGRAHIQPVPSNRRVSRSEVRYP
jgi:hypothetical protein